MKNAADEFLQRCAEAELFPDVFEYIASKDGLTDREQVDVLLVDQFQRWKKNQVIPVDQYFARTPEIDDLLKVDLLLEEYGYLDQRGIAPPPREFANRYQNLSLDAQAELCAGLEIDGPSQNQSSHTLESSADNSSRESKSAPEFIGRYQVVRLLGKGAFGKVFLAKDNDLDRSVAIKVPTNKRVKLGGGIEEFLKEARAVAKLEHPNIVPVFDCGITEDNRCFVVSKFIRGKELRAEIRKGFTHRESAMVIGALARALHAAHTTGIVHRDVKPGNVIIDSKRRPHLLDFGLALNESDAIDGDTFVGTPAYMSPEQAEGGSHRIDGRSDVYSLAVIFYEMLTGHHPYKSDRTDEILALLKHGEIRPPRQSDDGIPSALEEICLKALSRNLGDRYNTAKDMADEIDEWLLSTSNGEDSLESHRSWKSSHRHAIHPTSDNGPFYAWRTVAIVTFLGLLVLALLASLTTPPWKWQTFTRQPKTIDTPESDITPAEPEQWIATKEQPARIAVLGFRNLSGQSTDDWLSTALTELLIDELKRSDEFVLLSGEAVAVTKLDLGLSDSDSLGTSTLNRIRDRLNADWVIYGSYSLDSNSTESSSQSSIRFSTTAQNAFEPDHQRQFSNVANETQWIDLCPTVASQLRAAFRLGPPDISGVGEALPALPGPAAAKDYFVGVSKLHRDKYHEAIESFTQAASLDPNSPIIHDGLAQALKQTGDELKARQHSQKAVEFCGVLPEPKRLQIKARHCLLDGKPTEASNHYRQLFEMGNKNPDVMLQLSSALTAAGQGRAALKLVNSSNVDSFSISDQARAHLTAAKAAQSVSEFKMQVEEAKSAVELAKQIDARLLQGNANLIQGEGLRRLGQHDEASVCFDHAVKIFHQSEAVQNVATALTLWGKALIDNGQLELAEAKIQESMQQSQTLNNKRLIAKNTGLLGELAIFRGKFPEAIEALQQSLKMFTELGDWQGVAGVNLTLANVLARTGKLDQAIEMVAAARKAYQTTGNRLAEGRTWGQEGAMRARTGDTIEGQRHFERALELFREVGDQRSIAICLGDLASTHSNLGQLEKAGQLYSEALELHRKIGSKRGPEMILFNLSNLYARTGRYEDSHRLMEESFNRFKNTERWMNAVFVQRKLADMRLKLGDLRKAQSTLDSVAEKCKEVGSLATEAQVEFTRHHVSIFEGDFQKAESHVKASQAISRQLKQDLSVAMCDFALAYIAAQKNELNESLKLLNGCETRIVSLQPEFKPTLLYFRARAEASAGNHAAAELAFEKAESASAEATTKDQTMLLNRQHERALALLARGEKEAAAEALATVERQAQSFGWKSLQWEAVIQKHELMQTMGMDVDLTQVETLNLELHGKGFLDFEKRVAALLKLK